MGYQYESDEELLFILTELWGISPPWFFCGKEIVEGRHICKIIYSVGDDITRNLMIGEEVYDRLPLKDFSKLMCAKLAQHFPLAQADIDGTVFLTLLEIAEEGSRNKAHEDLENK